MSNGGRAGDGPAKSRPKSLVFKCCSGFRHQQRVLIMKIKGKAGTKAMRHALRMQRIMTLLERAVVADLTTGLAVFKRRIDRNKMEKLLDQGKFEEAMAVIPWDNMPDDLKRIEGNLEKAVIRASEQSIAMLPGPKAAFIVGTANPRVREFIAGQVGSLVVGIQNDARKSIKNAVTQSFNQGLTPRRTASLMRESVGLTEKQNAFVMNKQFKEFDKRDRLRTRLNSLNARGLSKSPSAIKVRATLAGLTDDRIQRRSEIFAKNLQKQRSITIARTELTRAVTAGQTETWIAAANEGLIDGDTARKIWVVVPDDRLSDICADLDGKTVALGEKFFVNQTGEMVDGPPAHPNCRSAVAIKFEEEE